MDRKVDPEDHSVRNIARRQKLPTMGSFDRGAVDRKADSGASGFCREKWSAIPAKVQPRRRAFSRSKVRLETITSSLSAELDEAADRADCSPRVIAPGRIETNNANTVQTEPRMGPASLV
jgi:hypothetical protein